MYTKILLRRIYPNLFQVYMYVPARKIALLPLYIFSLLLLRSRGNEIFSCLTIEITMLLTKLFVKHYNKEFTKSDYIIYYVLKSITLLTGERRL